MHYQSFLKSFGNFWIILLLFGSTQINHIDEIIVETDDHMMGKSDVNSKFWFKLLLTHLTFGE